MSNFKDDLLAEAAGQTIEAICIGDMGWSDFNHEHIPNWKEVPRGKLLNWQEAAPLLDFNYSTGYGAPECPCVYAWTKDYVIFISQYDGSTCTNKVPRNPCDCDPQMPGG